MNKVFRAARVPMEILGAVGLVCLVVWYSLSTSFFLAINSFEYRLDTGLIVWQRDQRFGSHWLDWTIEAEASDGSECYAAGNSLLQVRERAVYVPIPHALDPCLTIDSVPTTLHHRFQVSLFDWLPLRPTRFVIVAQRP